MKQFVLSIEQMYNLQELGIDTSKSHLCFAYNHIKEKYDVCMYNTDMFQRLLSTTYPIVHTFTLQEIIDLLPKHVFIDKGGNRYYAHLEIGKDYAAYTNESSYTNLHLHYASSFPKDNPLDACYDLLCWCIERGYLNVGKREKD